MERLGFRQGERGKGGISTRRGGKVVFRPEMEKVGFRQRDMERVGFRQGEGG